MFIALNNYQKTNQMKKLIIALLLISNQCFTQVGIRTTNPQETLHVNGGVMVSDLQNNDISTVLSDTAGRLIKRNRIIGKINASGTAILIQGATCSRISQGEYQITFASSMLNNDYLIVLSKHRYHENGHDDPNITYYDQQTTGFKIEIENGDNGNDPGVSLDLEFMFKVEGIN